MEIATALFATLLIKSVDYWIDKIVETTWSPTETGVKALISNLTRRREAAKRREELNNAIGIAYQNTLREARDPGKVELVFKALRDNIDRDATQALADESAKVLLSSATPNVERLISICEKYITWRSRLGVEVPEISSKEIALILDVYLKHLRKSLRDQPSFSSMLSNQEVVRLLDRLVETTDQRYHTEQDYVKQVLRVHGVLGFSGIPELRDNRPVTVNDIFIPSRLTKITPSAPRNLENIKATGIFSTEEIEVLREVSGNEGTSVAANEQVSIFDLLSKEKHLVILGDPGSGKTTLLKYLAISAANGTLPSLLKTAHINPTILPIFIPLREFVSETSNRHEDYNLVDYMRTRAYEHLAINVPKRLFVDALEIGRCFVCLDGLDEVWSLSEREFVAEQVSSLVRLYPENFYICTSRIVGYSEAPVNDQELSHYTLLELNSAEIEEFVRKWYALREEDLLIRRNSIDNLIDTIQADSNIGNLAKNPLLLTIIALVHKIEAELPHERVQFYRKCITALVETWDNKKDLTIEDKKRPFYSKRNRLLRKLAYHLHVTSEKKGKVTSIKLGDLRHTVASFLMEERSLEINDYETATEEAERFIELIQKRTGVLIESGNKVFSFAHLTFQEYLTAAYLESRFYDTDVLWKEISERIHDPHWREVTLLLLGLLNDYDDKLNTIIERIRKASTSDPLEQYTLRSLRLIARAIADRVNIDSGIKKEVVLRLANELEYMDTNLVSVSLESLSASGLVEDILSLFRTIEPKPYLISKLYSIVDNRVVDKDIIGLVAFTLGVVDSANAETVDKLLALTRLGSSERVIQGAVIGLGYAQCCHEKISVELREFSTNLGKARLLLLVANTLGKIGLPEEAINIVLQVVSSAKTETINAQMCLTILDNCKYVGDISRIEALLSKQEARSAEMNSPTLSANAVRAFDEIQEPLRSLLALVYEKQAAGADIGQELTQILRCKVTNTLEYIFLNGLLTRYELGKKEQFKVLFRNTVLESSSDFGIRLLMIVANKNLLDENEVSTVFGTIAADSSLNLAYRLDAASVLGMYGQVDAAQACFLELVKHPCIQTGRMLSTVKQRIYETDSRAIDLATFFLPAYVTFREDLNPGCEHVIDANVYIDQYEYEAALDSLEKACAAASIASRELWRGLVLTYLERYEEALKVYETVVSVNDGFSVRYDIAVAKYCWDMVDRDEVRKAITVARDALTDESTPIGFRAYGLAGLEALQGNANSAFQLLSDAIEESPEQTRRWARHDRAWVKLRTDKRFLTLIGG